MEMMGGNLMILPLLSSYLFFYSFLSPNNKIIDMFYKFIKNMRVLFIKSSEWVEDGSGCEVGVVGNLNGMQT